MHNVLLIITWILFCAYQNFLFWKCKFLGVFWREEKIWLDISADAFTDKQPKLEHELWRGRFQDSMKTSVQISSLAESLPRLREGEGQCYSYISSSPSAGFPSVSVCALYCCTVVNWGKHFITIVIYITQQMITGMSNILLKLSGFWLIKIFTVYFY